MSLSSAVVAADGTPAQAHEVEAVLPAEAVGARGAVVVEESGAVGDGDRFQEHLAERPVPFHSSGLAVTLANIGREI